MLVYVFDNMIFTLEKIALDKLRRYLSFLNSYIGSFVNEVGV